MLREGAAFVAEGLEVGERVLVHCQYGIGRSPLVALCALVHRGVPPLSALEAAKRGRPVISPSPDQLHAFRQFAARVKAERGCEWEVPSLGALGEIAWRHLGRGEAWPSEDAARAGSTRG
jgi:protein-tyrosine phosphatase